MFWIFKRLFWLGVFIAIIYYGAQYKIDGKPVKEYAKEFYNSPLVQAVVKTGKEMIGELWEEKEEPKEELQKIDSADGLTDQDREALDRMVEEQNR